MHFSDLVVGHVAERSAWVEIKKPLDVAKLDIPITLVHPDWLLIAFYNELHERNYPA